MQDLVRILLGINLFPSQPQIKMPHNKSVHVTKCWRILNVTVTVSLIEKFTMPKESKLVKLYSQVSSCSQNCESIRNEPENGIMGRSYYCPYNTEDVTLLMVSKNPGIGKPIEADLYKLLSPIQRVTAHEKFVMDRFEGRNNIITSKYHKNILEWVSIILDVAPNHDAVFSKAAMTAMVKCQSVSDKTAKLPPSTVEACTNRFLFQEIEQIKPKLLLALGSEAYRFLNKPQIRERHSLPIAELYHPSWTNMKGGVDTYKKTKLLEIRKYYQEVIKS
jgi:DNA polymerase